MNDRPISLLTNDDQQQDFRPQEGDLHPALPSLHHAELRILDTKNPVLSDHVYLQLKFETGTAGEEIVINTSNMLAGSTDGAYAYVGRWEEKFRWGSLVDNNIHIEKRRLYNAHYIDEITNEKNLLLPDFICIQEIDDELQKDIHQEMNKQTERPFVFAPEKDLGEKTLYNSNGYDYIEEPMPNWMKPSKYICQLTQYKRKKDEKTIFIWNVHHNFSLEIDVLENSVRMILERRRKQTMDEAIEATCQLQIPDEYKALLQGMKIPFKDGSPIEPIPTKNVLISKLRLRKVPENVIAQFKEQFEIKLDKANNEVFIYVGDWNKNMASPHNHVPTNIITAIGPPLYHKGQIQGALFLDGGFSAYLDLATEKYIIKQAPSIPMNGITAKSYTEIELAPLDVSLFSPEYAEEIARQKIILCLDSYYETKNLISIMTIFTFQDWLRSKLLDKRILVRATKNANNQPGIGIRLDDKMIEALKTVKDYFPEIHFQFNADMIGNIVCVPQHEAHYLVHIPLLLQLAVLLTSTKKTNPMDMEKNVNILLDLIQNQEPFRVSEFNLSLLEKLFAHIIKENNYSINKNCIKRIETIILRYYKDNKILMTNDYALIHYTLIHHVAHLDLTNVMEVLLQSPIANSINTATVGSKRTALSIAVFRQNKAMMALLITHGADITQAVESENLPLVCIALERAAAYHMYEGTFANEMMIVKVLLENQDITKSNKFIFDSIAARLNQLIAQCSVNSAQWHLLRNYLVHLKFLPSDQQKIILAQLNQKADYQFLKDMLPKQKNIALLQKQEEIITLVDQERIAGALIEIQNLIQLLPLNETTHEKVVATHFIHAITNHLDFSLLTDNELNHLKASLLPSGAVYAKELKDKACFKALCLADLTLYYYQSLLQIPGKIGDELITLYKPLKENYPVILIEKLDGLANMHLLADLKPEQLKTCLTLYFTALKNKELTNLSSKKEKSTLGEFFGFRSESSNIAERFKNGADYFLNHLGRESIEDIQKSMKQNMKIEYELISPYITLLVEFKNKIEMKAVYAVNKKI